MYFFNGSIYTKITTFFQFSWNTTLSTRLDGVTCKQIPHKMYGKVASCWSCWCWVEILYQQKFTPKKGDVSMKKVSTKRMWDNKWQVYMFGLASWFGLKKHLESKGSNDDCFLGSFLAMYSFTVIFRECSQGASRWCLPLQKAWCMTLWHHSKKTDPVENWTHLFSFWYKHLQSRWHFHSCWYFYLLKWTSNSRATFQSIERAPIAS